MRFSAFDFDVITSPPPEPEASIAMPQTLRLLSTLALQGALEAAAPSLAAALDTPIAAEFAPTKVLVDRLAGGESADVVILTAEAVAALGDAGRLASSAVALAASRVGLAQAPGLPHPDIATPDALVATLRAARSIAYSGAGASGIFFAGLLERLGIAVEINAKATVIPSGLTGALVADGRVQYAVQQISELRLVPGIDIIGPLPASVQTPAVFSAAVMATAGGGGAGADATRLLGLLAGPAMAAAFAASGLEPLAASAASG
jgi:molybdate transport system substrate-binding protein